MDVKQQLLGKLAQIAATSEVKSTYIVEFKGVQLSFSSGKSSWKSLGAAKNALRNALYSIGHWKERLETLKELEKEGLIVYKEVK